VNDIVEKLLNSNEPSVRFKVLVNVLGKNGNSDEIKKLQQKIKYSLRVKKLLSVRDKSGKIPYNPYCKWYGAHWIMPMLAELGYPPGDTSLIPIRDQVYNCWLSPEHIKKVPIINGRSRRCGSQEGNALYAILTLGLDNGRCDEIVQNLLKWQWEDGGWNCDKRPEATHSSFHETLIPLRALSLYGRLRKCNEALESAQRASEVFLKRKLFRRQSDGKIINEHFLKLHYPYYWHYDILFGLKVMAETGFISDERCQEALDILESKQLPDGGFPAEEKYYRYSEKKPPLNRRISNLSLVDWCPTSKRRMNEFVTADALYVLKKANRFVAI